jgi:predicted O-methyltransferase YrrM
VLRQRLAAIAARTYDKVAHLLPGRVAAFIDYRQKRYLSPWNGPFNGQDRRCELFLALVRAVGALAIVETGTFRGTTTAFMYESTGLPIWTVEKSGRFFHYARLRLGLYPAIHVVQGDSRQFLGRLAASGAVNPTLSALFYLDAHWERDLPLKEEVALILANFARAVIVVDDFQVADDPGYHYDDYGERGRISHEYLVPALPEDIAAFVPAVASERETGARRGCAVYATASLAPMVRGLALLRPMATARPTPAGPTVIN